MEPTEFTAALASILASLEDKVVSGQLDLATAVKDAPFVIAAGKAVKDGNPKEFARRFSDPLDQLADGVLRTNLCPAGRALFLFKHFQFVEAQFKSVIEKKEGRACSADKTATVLRALAEFFLAAKPIVFNYQQERIFHLPRDVFVKQADILTFFSAVHRLYYGDSTEYVNLLNALFPANPAVADPADRNSPCEGCETT